MRAKKPYKKNRKRIGHGIGSGHGKTSCRGQKGQKSRSGYTRRGGFEGGQNPLYRRLPKRGFSNVSFETRYAIINIGEIAELGHKEVTPEILKAQGTIKKIKSGLKVLGAGEISIPVIVKAHRFSESAKAKIEKAGGQAVLIA
ncbi:MAG: 50S ribosomal protein L15 [Candidatus Omnitrophica bacterium]|nr:50S ribosomal protein L15 [Candidatus Omnitrophota bacterium]